MAELKEHEVLAETKSGQKLVVSAKYYAQNKNSFKKMLDDNGWKDKMDTLNLNDKGSPKPSDTTIKAKDHKGNADMTEAEKLAEQEKAEKAKK